MRRRLSDRDADALLRGPELAGFVSDLQAIATDAPAPSADLAALLAGGLVPDARAIAGVRPRKRWLVALPITSALLAGTLGAASANVLPDRAQQVVSDTVSSITPIHLPKPGARKPTPEPTARLAPAATAAPTSRPASEPGEDPRPSVRPSHSAAATDDHRGPGSDDASPSPASEPGDDHPAPTSGDDGHHDGGSGDGGEGHHGR